MKLIGARGGKARARNCTPEQIKEWGRKGGKKAGETKRANKIKAKE